MTIEVRPPVRREAIHPSITGEQISELVDSFYGKILSNERLGPVFSHHINDGWDKHLEKMKAFWRSVLLRTGEYKGKPVPVHLKIAEIDTEAFGEWLRLFSATTDEIMCREAAVLTNEAAQRIATSLWLSRSQDPFVTPPEWSQIAPDPTHPQSDQPTV